MGCNTEEYRKYKVKGKPEGKELKRMLGFIVVRGTGILYVQPEELGKEELVEPVKARKVKVAQTPTAKAAPAAPAGMPGVLPGLMPRMMPTMPSMPGMFPGMMPVM